MRPRLRVLAISGLAFGLGAAEVLDRSDEPGLRFVVIVLLILYALLTGVDRSITAAWAQQGDPDGPYGRPLTIQDVFGVDETTGRIPALDRMERGQ